MTYINNTHDTRWSIIKILKKGVKNTHKKRIGVIMADMPDLSHLTPEERAIIENVMQRQKQEEDRENEIMRWGIIGAFDEKL